MLTSDIMNYLYEIINQYVPVRLMYLEYIKKFEKEEIDTQIVIFYKNGTEEKNTTISFYDTYLISREKLIEKLDKEFGKKEIGANIIHNHAIN